MFEIACLTHWYESLLFFGPIPFVGLFVWLSGRRHARDEQTEQRDARDAQAVPAPPRALG